MPRIVQLTHAATISDADELERRCFRARRRAEKAARDAGIEIHFPSWSFRTVVYKGLVAAPKLANFYADLADERFEAPFAVFHQRYATNTRPTWERAQPFRFLCHNGEINAIQGNINQMRAREGRLGSQDLAPDDVLSPVLDMTLQDSGLLDNALELLVRGGRDVRHAIHMLVPDAWETKDDVPPDLEGFYRYHSCLDRAVGRSRRSRSSPTASASARRSTATVCVRCARRSARTASSSSPPRSAPSISRTTARSRAASSPRDRSSASTRRSVTPPCRTTRRSSASSRRPSRTPSGPSACSRARAGTPRVDVPDDLIARQAAFGVTKEEITVIVEPMAKYRKEPTSSMGDDTQAPFLTTFARPLFNFFKQRFAQVTNPPIDHLRERLVMSKRTLVGPRKALLTEDAGRRRPLRVRVVRRLPGRRRRPVRRLAVGRRPDRRDVPGRRWPGRSRARAAHGSATRPSTRSPSGVGVLVVSDRAVGAGRAAIPSLAAVGAVHHQSRARRAAHAGLDRVRLGRAARDAPLRVPRRLRRRPDLPVAHVRAPRRTRVEGHGRRPARRRSARELHATRSRTASSRSCRRWGSRPSTPIAARRSSRPTDSAAMSSSSASTARSRRSGASASPSSARTPCAATRTASASRRRASARPASSSTSTAASTTPPTRTSSTRCTWPSAPGRTAAKPTSSAPRTR